LLNIFVFVLYIHNRKYLAKKQNLLASYNNSMQSSASATDTSNKGIKWVEIPISAFQYYDSSIMEQFYDSSREPSGELLVGDTEAFMALPKPTFPPRPEFQSPLPVWSPDPDVAPEPGLVMPNDAISAVVVDDIEEEEEKKG
jgi:hypothetical protein